MQWPESLFCNRSQNPNVLCPPQFTFFLSFLTKPELSASIYSPKFLFFTYFDCEQACHSCSSKSIHLKSPFPHKPKYTRFLILLPLHNFDAHYAIILFLLFISQNEILTLQRMHTSTSGMGYDDKVTQTSWLQTHICNDPKLTHHKLWSRWQVLGGCPQISRSAALDVFMLLTFISESLKHAKHLNNSQLDSLGSRVPMNAPRRLLIRIVCRCENVFADLLITGMCVQQTRLQ